MATIEVNSYELRAMIVDRLEALRAELLSPHSSVSVEMEADRVASVCERLSLWAREMKASSLAERGERTV